MLVTAETFSKERKVRVSWFSGSETGQLELCGACGSLICWHLQCRLEIHNFHKDCPWRCFTRRMAERTGALSKSKTARFFGHINSVEYASRTNFDSKAPLSTGSMAYPSTTTTGPPVRKMSPGRAWEEDSYDVAASNKTASSRSVTKLEPAGCAYEGPSHKGVESLRERMANPWTKQVMEGEASEHSTTKWQASLAGRKAQRSQCDRP